MQSTKTKTTPNCLRRYRKARGFQQKEVSKILGLKSASMISRWENGVCLPSTLNLFRLASVYRTMVDALFIDLLREVRSELQITEEKLLRNKAAKPCQTNTALRSGI